MTSTLTIPLISRFVATHYSYEALIVAQAKLNPLSIRQDRLQHQIDALVAQNERTPEESTRLEDLKDTLALLSGLECGSVADVEKRLRRVDGIINGKPLDAGGLRCRQNGVTAERLYTNQKVTDLVSKAETEQNDYRRAEPVNSFFSPKKRYQLIKIGSREIVIRSTVFTFNAAVLILSSLATLVVVYLILLRQLRPRGV